MSKLWNAKDAATATSGQTSGSWEANGVIIDSRVVKGGELFVAFPGERVDGHEFVSDALKRGAAAAMVSREIPGVSAEKLLIVRDVQVGLEALGAAGRARSKAHIVAVTGSVGKTSAKELLRMGLGVHGQTFASFGNFNNHIGTPLNLANLPPNTDFAVFELGMNHAGEIAALTRQVKPHVALITNVEAVHLEFFPSVEAIADAKSEIFEGLQPNGFAVLNYDNAQYARCVEHAKARGAQIISFGQHGGDIRLLDYHPSLHGSRVTAQVPGQEVAYNLRTVGLHWALASLGTLAVAQAFGLDLRETAVGLEHFQELPGRGSVHPIRVSGGEALLVDDSYNASPAAMRASFARLKELKANGAVKGRLLAALGDMRELGKEAEALHVSLAKDIAAAGIDQVFTAGPLMRHLHEALPSAVQGEHVPDAAALLPVLHAALKPGDALLIKGSHGSLMYTVSEALLKEAAEQERDHVV